MTLEILAQKNRFLMTSNGDFKAKSENWYSPDKPSFESKTIESTTSKFGLYQLKLTSHGILHYLWSAGLSKGFS